MKKKSDDEIAAQVEPVALPARRVLRLSELRRLMPGVGSTIHGHGVVRKIDPTGLVVVLTKEGEERTLDALAGFMEVPR